MKYQSFAASIQDYLGKSESILIALPLPINIDILASGLALYLSLKQQGKKVSIVTSDTIRVGHTNLFGVGDVKNQVIPQEGGDLTIVLGGIVTPDGQIPALEKLDYFASGSDWNLVFRQKPGQKLEPTFITPKRSGGINLIFTVGAGSLESLGSVYQQLQGSLQNTTVINIDNNSQNSQFGQLRSDRSQVNIVDPEAATLSEMVAQTIINSNLPFDTDIATNILSGIFDKTVNLTAPNVSPETFEVISLSLRAGGKRPSPQPVVAPSHPRLDQNQPSSFDLNKMFGANVFPTTPQPQSDRDQSTIQATVSGTKEVFVEPSPEEVPVGEEVVTPEDDWLTPKIYKGSDLG